MVFTTLRGTKFMSLLDNQTYTSALTLLSHDQDGDKERLLRRILEWEETHPPENEHWGFEWYEVHGDPRTLNSLVIKEVLRVTLKTNKCTVYRPKDPKAIKQALLDYQGMIAQPEEVEEIPEDLFKIIVDHEEKKEILWRSLDAERVVSVLLWGSVASAKTLFLQELSRLPGSQFILGSSLTKAGLFDVLFNERPRYLVLDELDKISDVNNLSALLSLMETGIVTETKYRRHRFLRLKTWVYASANDIRKIPLELKSRFLKLRFKDYTRDEFYDVVVTILKEREAIKESLGIYIAEKVIKDLNSKDVRDSVKIARLLKKKNKKEVDLIVKILKKQK